MKVLYVIDGPGGGAVTHVIELAAEMPTRGIGTEIVFFSTGPAFDEARRRGIQVYYLPKQEWRMAAFIWKLARFVKDKRIDIIHSHTINANFFARVAGMLARVPVVTTVHSYIIDEMKGLVGKPSWSDRARYELDVFMTRWSSAMVAISGGISERLRRRGVPSGKLRIIPNGVDVERFKPAGSDGSNFGKEFGIDRADKVVAIVARLVPLKNHRGFLTAAENIARRFKNVKFLVIGDGPLRDELERLSENLGIADKTIFTGWRNDVEQILPHVDIVVLCSLTEGHGIAVLEAMACGKPVVGTDVREINNTVVHEENGILVPPEDEQALAEAVLRLLQNPKEADEMGTRARAYVGGKFSMEGMFNEYEKVYNQVIKRSA